MCEVIDFVTLADKRVAKTLRLAFQTNSPTTWENYGRAEKQYRQITTHAAYVDNIAQECYYSGLVRDLPPQMLGVA